MGYQVWTYDEFEGWSKVDCRDLPAVQSEILEALKKGKDPLVTVTIPFDVSIKVKEDKIGEVPKGKPPTGKGPGPAGKGEDRPGDLESVQE